MVQLRPKGWGWAAIGTFCLYGKGLSLHSFLASPPSLPPSFLPSLPPLVVTPPLPHPSSTVIPTPTRTGPIHDMNLPKSAAFVEGKEGRGENGSSSSSSPTPPLPKVRVHVKVKLAEGSEDYFEDDIEWDVTNTHLPEPEA